MRAVLGRLFAVLVFWFCIIDLFLGKPNRQWLWTFALIGVWLTIEGLWAFAVRAYIRRGSHDRC